MSNQQAVFTIDELMRQRNGYYQLKVDHVDEFTTIRGLASRTTTTDQAAWLLEQTIVTSGVEVDVLYADNAQFTQVWDDRLTVFPSVGSGAVDPDTNFFIPARRVLDSLGQPISDSNPLDITGNITTGLRIAIKTTVVTVGTSATPLPATSLGSRNSMVILNKSSTDTLYIGDATVTAAGATSGWEIDPNSEFAIDITDSIVLYGIVAAGSITVKVLEIA